MPLLCRYCVVTVSLLCDWSADSSLPCRRQVLAPRTTCTSSAIAGLSAGLSPGSTGVPPVLACSVTRVLNAHGACLHKPRHAVGRLLRHHAPLPRHPRVYTAPPPGLHPLPPALHPLPPGLILPMAWPHRPPCGPSNIESRGSRRGVGRPVARLLPRSIARSADGSLARFLLHALPRSLAHIVVLVGSLSQSLPRPGCGRVMPMFRACSIVGIMGVN